MASGNVRLITAEFTRNSKLKGKAFSAALAKALSPENIAKNNTKTQPLTDKNGKGKKK